MKMTVLLSACLLLAACATQVPEPVHALPSVDGDLSGSVASGREAALLADTDVKEIAITPVAEETVCRREQPTGSRITVERCYVVASTVAGAVAQGAVRQVMREEFELLRRLQMAQEQARQQAMQERAMRDAARPQPSP